ncbi:helix-turn-helix domain-containing protein [Burkholderia pseudomallei]|uniref:helix-turn-helix domain-containing protein n=1 Tax=Burkholderia pseudomallei TaxID=28450 RepID=UPI0009E3EF2D|nr:helix-turn-helix transcriptional regulator [Burkholderia pseudomallei]
MNFTATIKIMQANARITPSQVVRDARQRKGLTQYEFAKELKSTQSLISKYEAGKIDPPSDLIIQCMNIICNPIVLNVSEAALVKLIRANLHGPQNAAARSTIAAIVERLSQTNK